MSDTKEGGKPNDSETTRIISPDDVNVVAAKLARGESNFKVLSYHLRPFSAEKLGFAASHQQLSLTFQKNDASSPETVNVFVKAVPLDNKVQADVLDDTGIFVKESYIFSTVIPILTENYRDDKWAPKCYLAKDDVLILEDLRNQNYKLVPKFFDELEMLRSSLATLAHFHGCSIVAEARLNENSPTPKTLLERFPIACKEVLFADNCAEQGKLFLLYATRVAMVVGETLGYDPRKIERALDHLRELVKPSKKHVNVLLHSDLWPNNQLWDCSRAGLPPRCILVDFQVCRYATFALDVLMTLHLNSSASFRRQHERDLLKSYHAVLEETVRNGDATGRARLPTLDEVFAAVEDSRLFGVGITSLYFPIVLIESKELSQMTASMEKYDNFFFGDRSQVTLDYMRKDAEYKAKVEEAVVELAKIAERL